MLKEILLITKGRSSKQGIYQGKNTLKFAELACSNLSQSLSFQSTDGGASGINTKSASDANAVTTARYLHQQTIIYILTT